MKLWIVGALVALLIYFLVEKNVVTINDPMSREQFAASFRTAAGQVDLKGINVNMALAWSAVETGWGAEGRLHELNNLFNIKASSTWKGETFTEVLSKPDADGNTTRVWRKYPSWAASIRDWVALIGGTHYYAPVYALLLAGDYKAAFQKAQDLGYAGTSKTYAAALSSTYEAVA